MIDKDPLDYPLITYAWVLFLAGWGGLVNFIQRVRAGDARAYNIVEFIGEIVIAGFVGVITFYLCELSGFPQVLTAVLVSVSGHMGARALFMIEKTIENIAKKRAGL